MLGDLQFKNNFSFFNFGTHLYVSLTPKHFKIIWAKMSNASMQGLIVVDLPEGDQVLFQFGDAPKAKAFKAFSQDRMKTFHMPVFLWGIRMGKHLMEMIVSEEQLYHFCGKPFVVIVSNLNMKGIFKGIVGL